MKLIIPAILCLAALQDEKVELRWKFAKGQELRYKTSQKATVEFAGNEMGQQSGTTYRMTVNDVDEKGVATITTKYEGVFVKSAMPQEFEYDSEKDKELPEEPMARMQAKLVGQSFTMKMTSAGKVSEVKGFEKILEGMLKDAPGDEAQQEMAREMIKQMFSDDTMKSMMQQVVPMLPEEKVGKGDKWTSDFTLKIPMLGRMKVTIASKLKEFKDKDAHIEQDLKIELKANEDEANPLAGLMEIKDMKGSAATVFSMERGIFLSSKSTMQMMMSAGGNEIPMKIETEMKLAEKKKDF